ncbi:MAG: response regulator [Candidatus Omnitrophica bacterium]|nr:response regulator [Candidatus Omnitrophota bacterium]
MEKHDFLKKNKILIVDDESDIVDVLKQFLCHKGYDVSGASSGEEALDILDEKRTDLVLLDIKMPGIQGTEVAKIVKEKYPHIKIIVVTGYAEEAESLSRDNLLAGLFVKPIQLQELYEKILEVLYYPEIKKLVLWVKTIILLTIKNIVAQDYQNN